METKRGGENHRFCRPGAPELKAVGKKGLEWDLNDWNWDGDLFVASPLNSMPSDCRSRQFLPLGSGMQANGGSSNSSSSCSDEITPRSEKGDRELEKRRRALVIDDDDLNNDAESLTLKLGGHCYPIMQGEAGNWDRKIGKKTKILGGTSNRAICQVEDCGVDLSNAKDYHRRHKVCEIHSKASRALVGNIMQRFCQQCSRFHALQEFDEGKRSCRRRLAGHNRRRRKTHPDAVVNGNSLNGDQASSYLLISLLRILTNMHSNRSDQEKDQDLLTHLLRNLATLANSSDGRNIPGLLQESQDQQNAGTSVGTSAMVPALQSNAPGPSGLCCSTKINGITGTQCTQMKPIEKYVAVTASEIPRKEMFTDDSRGALKTASSSKSTFPAKDSFPARAEASEVTMGRIKLSNIDLNNIYNDSQDCMVDTEMSPAPANPGTGSLDCPSWLQVQQDFHQSSPPQTSRNSDSASAQSPSSSSGDAQNRTDRIVFKLFGKDPTDFPCVLRAQILDWLSHSPTDIESYIRPGCIILTIYLRLVESAWEKLSFDLTSSLSRLLDVSDGTFWRTGWVYIRVQHQIAFMYNGQVVLDTTLPAKSQNNCWIASVKPIAVSISERAQFIVRGYNLSWPTTRLLCALEGKYLLHKATRDLVEDVVTSKEHDELQCLSFTCTIPNVTGRGFIEVEDYGLSGGFFPFIVAEHDLCSEIRMLESVIEVVETDDQVLGKTERTEAKNQALDFVNEMGWLLHRSHLQSRLDHMDPGSSIFSFKRFRWLMEFSMDHDWCAVVKKLLDILFEGTVHVGEDTSIELALSEMGLLHRAVRRNSTPLVQLLLRYVHNKASNESGSESKQHTSGGHERFLFRPDVVGPAGLTPLHVAAGRDDSESVVDALTDDPGLVGIEAWKHAYDNTGFTPEDYAHLRGHYSYIHLVQRKVKKKSESVQVVLDIPSVASDWNIDHKQEDGKVTGFQIGRTEPRPIQQHCKLCNRKLAYGTGRSMAYRPAMLSIVAIAAVCVCVALLFKSSPEVLCVFPPFRWELLDYGSI